MAEVQRAAKGTMSVKLLTKPNAKQVLDELKLCDVVHFACHGVSDFTDPSNSCLVLQAADKSHPDNLTVRQVSDVNLTRARIAYLSACSTVEIRAALLADEAIHLASGFQVAGFGHVIGCMWPSNDSPCVDVAKGFYERLGADVQSNRQVAEALHTSVMEVRVSKKFRKQPLSWAQYIHLGA
jgi:CHAT domain-containing protein